MFQKILIFRNLIDNIPKNIGLYMIGVLLLVANHFSIDYAKITLGLIVFLVSYSSIYIMNDLFDIDEDLITEDKVSRKPIAQGIVTKNEACLIFVILLAIGITLSFLLNSIFFVVICALVFINILYSVPPMRLKHS
ncbi:MAG: UbiA family prenyltransferase, partial [Candidatus Odinarchaeota archaeon]